MRTLTKLLLTALVLVGTTALAGPNDLVLEGLGDPSTDPAAHARFRILSRELGAALSSTNLMPAETLGHSAFAAALELSVLSLDTRSSADGFRYPTRFDPGDNPGLGGPLLLPSVHVRKGLPFSLELGGRIGWVDRSRMFAATAELKWAVTEGFAHLPDVAVRGYATRLFNARDLSLVTGGLDFGVSKQFPIGGMATLTPYGGWNPGFTGASSGRLFFAGRDLPAGVEEGTVEALLAKTDPYSDVRFLENMHHRFYGGLRFISGSIQLGAEVSFSSIPGFEDDAGQQHDAPPLLGFNTMLGLDF
ncbi:MAG: hypothetical protein L0Y66_17565 [Myxococcaceae bacterium]|nr:hypothetical protein [Myxococcaceae bacterium]MCI0670976.1 hypothetical protein [Myxococcaceae bacterium]